MKRHENTTVRRVGARGAVCLATLALIVAGCAVERTGLARGGTDGGGSFDGGSIVDLASVDLGARDLGSTDLGVDAGPAPVDLGPPDLGVDFGVDLGPPPGPCGGACTADQACVLGACVTCGGSFQPCCEMNRCMTGFACALGIGCTACGDRFQPCCPPGNTCNLGLMCNFGGCGGG